LPRRKLDPALWERKYREGTARAAREWFDAFLATTGIAEAAKSDKAQQRFEAKMSDPAILKKRQKRLAELTDEDFKAPVRAAGAAVYSTATAAKAGKARKRVAPFLAEIARIVETLEEKTDDPRQNVINRVIPIAVGLWKKARE